MLDFGDVSRSPRSAFVEVARTTRARKPDQQALRERFKHWRPRDA